MCSKNKNMHQRDFKFGGFNFTHFANLKNWRKFWVNLGKVTKGPISLANFHFGYLKGTRLKGFIFTHFVYNRNFGQIWIKIIEWSIRVENVIFVLVLQIMLFHFVYKKDFWHILVTFIVYKVSLLSSRSDIKHFRF